MRHLRAVGDQWWAEVLRAGVGVLAGCSLRAWRRNTASIKVAARFGYCDSLVIERRARSV